MPELTLSEAGVTNIAPAHREEALSTLIRHWAATRPLPPIEIRKATAAAINAMRRGDSAHRAYLRARNYLLDQIERGGTGITPTVS